MNRLMGRLGKATRRAGGAPNIPISQCVTVAVPRFDNCMQRGDLTAFRRGLQEMLITDLAQPYGVRIVEPARLGDVLAELRLAEGQFLDPQGVPDAPGFSR
jgi:hypothetical protein